MKPLYKWSGGKREEIKLFKKYYPDEFDIFMEPFFGAGAVYFDLSWEGLNVINDVHVESINFLRMISEGKAQEIYDLMSQHNNDEKTYYYVRDEFVTDTEVKEAFRFFYLRKTCFRGMLRYNSKGKFNIPFGRYKTYNFEEILDPSYSNLLRRTSIQDEDFSSIFKTYNNKSNFIFLDPPYDSEFTDYGYCKFGRDKQIELSEYFKKTLNKCLLIISETPFISDLYKDYIVDSYDKSYAFKIHSGRVGEEINKKHLIIKNY